MSDPDADDAGYREHYIRDAQGNIMATYRYTNNGSASLKLNDRPIYGSSRLGNYGMNVQLYNASAAIPTYPPPSIHIQKADLQYELTDHLGNVNAVLTGRLLLGNSGGTLYQPELASAQGYEPFGSLLPGRNYSSTTDTYRFGFQGQESDGEINGERNSYAFEYRMHDPRVGRFLSIDPLAAKYPHNSPYAFSENRVIDAVELEGKESLWYMLDDRVQVPTPAIAVTTSHAVAIGVDLKGNVGIMYTPSLGVGEGGGVAVSQSLVFSTANMNEIGGFGFTVGMMAAGGGGISGEGNVAWPSTSSDHANYGFTAGTSYGVFAGGYIEAQYSFVAYTQIEDIPESVFSTVETLSGWSKEQTLGKLQSMQSQLNTLMTQSQDRNDQYTPAPVKALQDQFDLGKLFEGILKSVLPDQIFPSEGPPNQDEKR